MSVISELSTDFFSRTLYIINTNIHNCNLLLITLV